MEYRSILFALATAVAVGGCADETPKTETSNQVLTGAHRSADGAAERLRVEARGLSLMSGVCPIEPVDELSNFLEDTWMEFERAFFEQTERVEVLPVGNEPAAPVRVEIIDSAVTRRDGLPSHGRLGHGRALGLIVRNLACPEAGDSCRAEVASTLVLPLIDSPDGVVRDEAEGGYYGSLEDLAAAIDDAVMAWRNDAPGHRLVINLSLGWESELGGEYDADPSELEGPARGVWDAIARARCYGAAVIAAAGNRQEGPDAPDGPSYPAAWASKPAATLDMCSDLGVEEVPDSYLPSEPLVFAVGGLESNDADLGLGRPLSRPELVAPAAHAIVADDDSDNGHSTLQTGTSVAAAVASAATAIVWSYRPELSAHEAIETIYQGGADVGRPAEVCAGSGPCVRNAHRVSICGALVEACSEDAGGCPSSVPECDRQPGGRDARPNFEISMTDRVVSGADLVAVSSVEGPCFGEVYGSSELALNIPCPASQLPPGYLPSGVTPQPKKGPVCPHCAYLRDEGRLFIEIDPAVTWSVGEPVLTIVVDSAAGDVRFVNLAEQIPCLAPGESVTVTDLEIEAPTFESATIEFVIDGEYSERSPVLGL